MELPGKKKRGRPKRRFMDVVKEDMAEVEVTEEDTEDRNNWRWKTLMGKAERRRRVVIGPRSHCYYSTVGLWHFTSVQCVLFPVLCQCFHPREY